MFIVLISVCVFYTSHTCPQPVQSVCVDLGGGGKVLGIILYHCVSLRYDQMIFFF